jgi:hypothetical protein
MYNINLVSRKIFKILKIKIWCSRAAFARVLALVNIMGDIDDIISSGFRSKAGQVGASKAVYGSCMYGMAGVA